MGSKSSRNKNRDQRNQNRYPTAAGGIVPPPTGAAGYGNYGYPSNQYPSTANHQYSSATGQPMVCYPAGSGTTVNIPVSHHPTPTTTTLATTNPSSSYTYDPARNSHQINYSYHSPSTNTKIHHHAHYEHHTRIDRY